MTLEKQPKSMVIMGAGAIGVEFAYFYNAFGTTVTLVEMMPRILPVEDEEISALLQKSFTRDGIRVLTGTKVDKTEVTGQGVRITARNEKGATETIEADVLLVAIGVTPVLPDRAGVQTRRARLRADRRQPTRRTFLTFMRRATSSGRPGSRTWRAGKRSSASKGLYHGKKPRKVTVFPGCTYCQPQVASVGLTERAAKEKGMASTRWVNSHSWPAARRRRWARGRGS